MTSPNWQLYLQALEADASYNECRQFYTPTQAEILLQVQTCVSPAEQQDEQNPTQQAKKAPEPCEALAGLRTCVEQNEHVLLVGKPGSGKTTALRRLLWEDVNRGAEDEVQRQQIPLLVELRGCREGSVLDWLKKALRRSQLTKETPEELLNSEKLLLLFDGLNELPTAEGWQELEEFRRDFAATPMIFTTRALGAGSDLGIQKKLEMVPLIERQMREFVQKRLPGQADNLLRQLDRRLQELAETPLLLAMLCEVMAESPDGQIPKNRGDLFRRQFDRRYKGFKPPRLRNISDDSRRFTSELLQHLAFVMIQGDPHPDPCHPTPSWLTISTATAERILENFLTGRIQDPGQGAKEWLEDLLEYDLLQIASNTDEIEFHHQLFQEYYAAEHLLLKLSELLKNKESQKSFKCDYLNYLKWTEAIAMMLALVDEESQALRVVDLALDNVDIILGARLAGEVKPEFQLKTVGRVAEIASPKPLKIELLERTRSDKAIPGLLKALEDPDSYVRWRATEALGKLGSVEAIPGLLKALEDPNEYVRRRATEALGNLGSVEAIPSLLKALEDPNEYVRWRAIEALWNLGNVETIPSLIKALEDSNFNVRESATEALGKLGSVEAIPGLLKALEDPNKHVRESVTEALGKLGSVEAIPGLLKALEDLAKYVHVRRRATEALRKSGNVETIPGLLGALEDPDSGVRRRVTEALGTLGSVEAIPGLFKALEDPDFNVRWCATEALGTLGSAEAIPGLLKALEHPDSGVRRRASEALGKLGSSLQLANLWRSRLKEPKADYLKDAIAAIQSRCKFYNYEIFQSRLEEERAEISPSGGTTINNIGSVGNLNTGDVTVQGHQIGTQNNPAADPTE